MKALILTFFIIILCYSLFTRNKETKPEPVLTNKRSPVYEETNLHEIIWQLQSADSVFLINDHTIDAEE